MYRPTFRICFMFKCPLPSEMRQAIIAEICLKTALDNRPTSSLQHPYTLALHAGYTLSSIWHSGEACKKPILSFQEFIGMFVLL